MKLFRIVAAIAMFGVAIAASAQTERTLYTFTGGKDGYSPSVGLIQDSSGNLYGGTYFGGTINSDCNVGCGTIFQLVPNGTSWNFNTLYSFAGETTDIGHPSGPLAFDLNGNLFGAGFYGGPYPCLGGCGGLFELDRSNNWKKSTISLFGTNTGENPSGLTFYKGYFYGTTTFGPQSKTGPGFGTIYRLFQNKTGEWRRQRIYTFTLGNDGYEPDGYLAFDNQGNLYGSTPNGGTGQLGDIFQISGGLSGINFSVIDNANPGPLTFGKDGNFYAALPSGGSGNCGYFGCGSIVELQRTSTGWNQITLYEFTDPADGESPGSVVFDNQGNLYGTTLLGGTGTCNLLGASGCGTVFKLTPTNVGWQKTTLYNFTGGSDGELPNGNPLVIDANGNLYGATEGGAAEGGSGYGTIFEIQP